MSEPAPAITISHLAYAYGRSEAVHDFSLTVPRGKCYGLFGRNGAGKTTTMKCLINLLRPQSGQIAVFGLDPVRREVGVKRRLAYVPDQVAFYPWMTIRETFDYLASFRSHWNREIEPGLLERFRLDPAYRTSGLSKGQRTQVALIAAICPEPELLLLDEPTSGLDPIVRREFIETVIGAYQESAPDERTILVSTHLIAEFEGLIDEFAIMDQGRNVLTLEADEARECYREIRARFAGFPTDLSLEGALRVTTTGRTVEVIAKDNSERIFQELRQMAPEELTSESLSLEEIFVEALK